MGAEKPRIAILGTGDRGKVYANYILKNPNMAVIVALADTNQSRLEECAAKYGVAQEGMFASYQAFLQQPKMCDAVVVSLQDSLHYAAAMAALERGYHVLVEKPMSMHPHEILQMEQKSAETGHLLMVCHVLRYTPFFEKIKFLLDTQQIGQIMSIDLIENIGNIHFSHSYVRGNWSNEQRASSALMSKSCHDIDILHWLIDKPCRQVASFGSLTYFNSQNAPVGSTDRCLDGCAVERNCVYSANTIYVETDGWHRAIMTTDDKEVRMKAIQEGPYGRCVYKCDNNVMDHQVVLLDFEGGATASFSMMAFTQEGGRTIKVFGTEGQLRGHMEKNEIEVSLFNGETEIFKPRNAHSGHFGGDYFIMEDFLTQVKKGNARGGRTGAKVSAESHLITLAAEQARRENRVVSLQSFIEKHTKKSG